MPKTRNFSQIQHLGRVRTWIVDTEPTSKYFKLAELPDVLASGKNAFLINGSAELINTTEVLVEIEDVEGNAVFLKPIEKYSEGLARVVSIEVYPETPKGLATITILGEVHRDRDGNVVPDAWRNKYNVKWQRTVFIDPTAQNTTKIRLYDQPTLATKELLSIYRDTTQSLHVVSQSATMSSRVVRGGPTSEPVYVVESDRAFFVREMVGGSFILFPYNKTITKIVNDHTAIMVDQGSASLETFSSSLFQLSYSSSISYNTTNLTRSFVDAELTNLDTFSGEVYKIRLSVNSKESPTTFIPIGEVPVTPLELLVTESVQTGEQKTLIGYFTDQTLVDTYWTADIIGSSSYNP